MFILVDSQNTLEIQSCLKIPYSTTCCYYLKAITRHLVKTIKRKTKINNGF
jgi:hypothetical protein